MRAVRRTALQVMYSLDFSPRPAAGAYLGRSFRFGEGENSGETREAGRSAVSYPARTGSS
jgi:hypothetical protein